MKTLIEFNNLTEWNISRHFLRKIFFETMRMSGKLSAHQEIEISIAAVSSEEMRAVNKRYRKKDTPTDVLSFEEAEKRIVDRIPFFLGELIICPDYIKKNADEDAESFEYALSYIVSHGILHLLGYPHGKKMFSLQEKVADVLSRKQ